MQGEVRRSKKVKVWVRTRPTAHFAHHMIDLQPDEKVQLFWLSVKKYKRSFVLEMSQEVFCVLAAILALLSRQSTFTVSGTLGKAL